VVIIGVVPWREPVHLQAIVADFMVRIYGSLGGKVVAVLIVMTWRSRVVIWCR
jgi:hypothetical protein